MLYQNITLEWIYNFQRIFDNLSVVHIFRENNVCLNMMKLVVMIILDECEFLGWYVDNGRKYAV